MENKIKKIYIKKGKEQEILNYLKDDIVDFERFEEGVKDIIDRVKTEGDKAIYYYLNKFDKINLTPPYPLRVSKEEIDKAYNSIDKEILLALEKIIERVRRFHENQKEESWIKYDEEGSIYGTIIRPLDRVGVYVPGGRASYPSTLIMGVVPAQVAGVRDIAITTPPDPSFEVSPYILALSKLLGIANVYKMGGAYAIGALTYGTESIEPVDKIIGPGNIYVTIAKKLVWGDVDIDSLAGPSEVAIIADKSADPKNIILDMISQAEHDPYARAVLIAPSERLIKDVEERLFEEIEKQPRKDIILESITKKGIMVKVNDIESAILVSNYIAPEHLQLVVDEPFSYLSKIKNAGALFLGHYASVPLGDYIAGTNHILPTGRRARFSSGLGVHTFYKRMDFFYSEEEISYKLGEIASIIAEVEGLFAHKDRLLSRREK